MIYIKLQSYYQFTKSKKILKNKFSAILIMSKLKQQHRWKYKQKWPNDKASQVKSNDHIYRVNLKDLKNGLNLAKIYKLHIPFR